jgi:hypothetical protein
MSLRRIAVENYRCFRDKQELEIFPVTVVLGKNNSGKSALVRAPIIFSTGFGATTTAPLDLEHLGPESVDGFTDLIFEQNPHGKIRIEVEVAGQTPFRAGATVQNIDRVTALVSDFDIQTSGVDLRLSWVATADSLDPPRFYQLLVGGTERPAERVEFHGLLPTTPIADLQGWSAAGLTLGSMRYLSSQRASIVRQHRLPLGTPRYLGAQGEGMPGILAHDQVRGGELIRIINGYLGHIVPDWRLDETAMGPLFATVLRRRSSDTLQVNLADAGAGLAQVLPILVQCALDEQAGQLADPPLQIVEEPEMHLHPAAHAELADLYLRTAQATGTRFLIETHSETLLLRLRRRIAEENAYSADMVGIYVADQHDGVSTVRRISLDDLGNLGDEWPEGYFSQDYREVRALASAQLERSDHAS